MKFTIIFKIVLLSVLISSASHALMPPSGSVIKPRDNGILKDRTIIIKGMSLEYVGREQIKIIDAKTKEEVDYKKKLDCKWKNECGILKRNMPGCDQQYCTMKLIMENIVPGRKYIIECFGQTVRFTAGKGKKE